MGKNAQKPRRDWCSLNHIIAAQGNHNVATRGAQAVLILSFQAETEGKLIAQTAGGKDNFVRLRNWNHIVATVRSCQLQAAAIQSNCTKKAAPAGGKK
jgi:hypothetical protein